MKKITILFLALFTTIVGFSQEKFIDILKDELKYDFAKLQDDADKPYYMSFRVDDNETTRIIADFGSLVNSTTRKSRKFSPHIRIGDTMLDNYYYTSQLRGGGPVSLPYDDNEEAIRLIISRKVEVDFLSSKNLYTQTVSKNATENEESDKAPNFVYEEPVVHYEAPLTAAEYEMDIKAWEDKAREYSLMFREHQNIVSAKVYVIFIKNRKYFVDTKGASIAYNETYARLLIQATTKAEDGMDLPLMESYFAFTPNNLPSTDSVKADIDKMITTLEALRVAPEVSPYAGPSIMAGSAAGVFFHEIFGHRIEGQRMKLSNDGQTFKEMVNEILLPESMSVYDDPTLTTYAGQELYGYYKIDDQGVKPRRVDVIKDGVLNEFLMSRTAIDGFPRSNGHGRAQLGYQPTARQGNLIVETKDHKTEKELRALLRKEMKLQNKEFGYYFEKVTAGLAFTGAGQVNAFNVTPLVVYKIYLDESKPDELVRGVDMIGTPLSIFENIKYAGGDAEVFIGDCGAESRGVPVTAISPTVLLTKVEVQRKPKSKAQHPILSRPQPNNIK